MNGLAAIHFAIYWPLALKELIAVGVNINCEDSHGRRPIHLAVACRQRQAVEILLEADCAISTPKYSNSLPRESLRYRGYDQIVNLIIDVLINRHTRLMKLAASVLPDNLDLKQWITEGVIRERKAVEITQQLATNSCPVPAALELDGYQKGVYDTAEFRAEIRLTVPHAEKLWCSGFRWINECAPGNGLTPLLQSWFAANFEMVAWFIDKGANPFAKHRDFHISGLHLFAARLAYPGDHFRGDPSSIIISPQHIMQLQKDKSSCRDSCSCLCSMGGCTPLSTVVKQTYFQSPFTYAKVKSRIHVWRDKMLYRPEDDPEHLE